MADHSTGRPRDLIVTPWHLDEHIPAFPIPAGVTDTICPALPAGPVPARMTLLHQAVADAVARAARPLLLSGDCPTARAVVAGLQRRHRDLAVVWLDAHGDFNTPAITSSGYLGGMALAMLTGRTPGLFSDDLGLRPVADTNVVLADARDLDPAERDALTTSQVRRLPADPAAITSALVWVPKTSSTSCDLGIFVDQSTESIQPHDRCAGRWKGRGNGSQRWPLAERAVRPVLVVVHHVIRQHRLQMSPPQDQYAVQHLTTDRADPSFGDGVRPRRPHGCA